MKIRRIQIPAFNGFQAIDFTFEKHFKPQIFPIGGDNGAGKTFLLEFIFLLLSSAYFDDLEVALDHKLKQLGLLNDKLNTFDEIPLAFIDLEYENELLSLKYFLTPFDAEKILLCQVSHQPAAGYKNIYIGVSVDNSFNTLKIITILKSIAARVFFFANIKIPPFVPINANLFVYSLHITQNDLLFKSYGNSKNKLIRELLTEYAHDYHDNIVFIDNIEDGLHPDTQQRLIRFFEEKKHHCQFILGTNSYAVCDMLTPKHVKVLRGYQKEEQK